jgi:hypothetical protein
MGAAFLLTYALVPTPFNADVLASLKHVALNPSEGLASQVADLMGVEHDEDITAHLVDAVETVYEDYFYKNGTSREMTVLLLQEREYIFTGGLSWGDTPTDAYDNVWMAHMVARELEAAVAAGG